MSELLEQHSRTNIPRPVPPGPADTGRRAAPEPPVPPAGPAPNGPRSPVPPPAPESTGRRAAPDHFTPSAPDRVTPAPSGEPPRRPAAPNDFFAPAHEGTGTRTPRPMPEDGPRRAPNSRPAEVRRPDEGTGRRARPEPPEAPGGGRRAAEPPRRYAEGDPNAQRPVPPPPVRPDAPRPGEHTGRRARPVPPEGLRPDAPRPDAPRPDALRPDAPRQDAPRQDLPRPDLRRPVDDPAADVPRRVGENTGRRARPEPPDGPRRPAPRPEDVDPRRAPDGAGPRRRPVEGDPAGRRFAEGNAPRRLAEDGPEPPVRPGEGTGRRPMGPRPDEGTGRRPVPPDAHRPVDPRRLAGPPDDLDRGAGPRRLAGGPVDEQDHGSAPRRLAPGAPAGPRRPVGSPVDEQDHGSAPRRLAAGPAGPVAGPPAAPDAPGRRFAEDVAEQPAIADRLGAGAPPKATPPHAAPPHAAPPPVTPPQAAPPKAAPPSGPEPRDQIDPASLTTEMEAISDDVKKRREVDHTLARFSAVHDELAEQERLRKERRQKLMPWKADHDDDATEYASPVAVLDGDDGPRRRGRTAKHSRIVRTVKVVSLAAAVLVFVSTGLGWGAMLYIDSKFVEVDALGSNSAAVHEAEKQLGDENFLIVGSDSRAGAKTQDGVGDTEAAPGARSDVLMLAHIPADRKRMVVVSVPRDLTVTRPACEQWDSGTGQYTGTQLDPLEGAKANQAYSDGGPRCVAKFMTELTGLEINHFISVDFNGFRGMVDAVGEVEVCVPKPMVDDELGTIFDQAGRFQITGGKALDYVRARKVSGEQFGDYDRVTRQQKFLSALLRKALSSEILLNPGKLNSFLNAFAAATVGDNIGVNDMLTLAQSLRSLDAGRVSFVTVPHYTDEGPTLSNDDNIEMLREAETKALFQSIIDGTPLPDEKPDPSTQAAGTTSGAPTPAPAGPEPGKVVDPNGLKVKVLNGDPDSPGLANSTKLALEELGYEVVFRGNGEAAEKTIIKYYTGGEDVAATLAASIPGATLVADPTMGGAVELLIGSGWDEVVRAPGAGGGQQEPGTPQPPKDLEVVNAAEDPCA
ncbi:LCP family protein [Saccharothrix longispora]|uniref:LCP family protein required for cell wall assembly n=1 Tax=Saccharothrix longispora TaxID=33920 RepID=A0ABU1Q2G0_9PSEU|nr:LCP family protein [Saccharothrix longispora]MDR6597071.1 LCP family protein required for cell wall assembly [Saccharothrix longispora]